MVFKMLQFVTLSKYSKSSLTDLFIHSLYCNVYN